MRQKAFNEAGAACLLEADYRKPAAWAPKAAQLKACKPWLWKAGAQKTQVPQRLKPNDKPEIRRPHCPETVYYFKRIGKQNAYLPEKETLMAACRENRRRCGCRRVIGRLRQRKAAPHHKTFQRLRKEGWLVCRVQIKKASSLFLKI